MIVWLLAVETYDYDNNGTHIVGLYHDPVDALMDADEDFPHLPNQDWSVTENGFSRETGKYEYVEIEPMEVQ